MIGETMLFGRYTKPEDSGVSWWVGLSPAEFYAEANKRFPETGAGHIDRTPVKAYGPDDPGFNIRARRVKGAA